MITLIYKHQGRVTNRSTVKLLDSAFFNKHIESLKGKQIEIIVLEKEESPTVKQYGYYHGAIIPAALETEEFGGWEHKELDKELTKMFLSFKAMATIAGRDEEQEVTITPSKGNISRVEMTTFIEKALAFLAERGITIKPIEHYEYRGTYQTSRYKSKKRRGAKEDN